MTLGGLALAVGILVDEATVTIESINYHLEQGKDVRECDPRWRLADRRTGVRVAAVYLHRVHSDVLPQRRGALPVRTHGGERDVRDGFLVPAVAHAGADDGEVSAAQARRRRRQSHEGAPQPAVSKNPLVRLQRGFEASFERLRAGYHDLLTLAIAHRGRFLAGFLAFVVVSFLLAPFLGRNFFPQVDGGQILLHVRAPVGMRIEETAARFADVEKAIRQVIPPARSGGSGRQYRHLYFGDQYDLQQYRARSMSRTAISRSRSTRGTRRPPITCSVLRQQLPRRFPGMTFAFLPADIVSQILNFGAPAPIDLQVRGNDLAADYAYANRLLAQVRRITRRSRCAHPAVRRSADDRCQHRPHAGPIHRRDRGRRDRQSGRQPCQFHSGGPHLLAE